MEKAQKEQVLGEIKESFAGVQSIILADNRGLDVPTVTKMRDEFRKAGCHYRVLKNSLVRIAIKGSKLEVMTELLAGPTAVMWSTENPQAPAKLALQWAKDVPNQKFVLKGGYFDGQKLDVAGVDALSKLPGKDELRASFLMTLIAGPTDFVRTIIAGPQNFVYALDARRRQLAGE